MTEHYVYLFHTKQFVESKEPVYKIGKSMKPNFERFNQYSEGTRFHFQMSCHNCHELEKKIIALFRINYKLHCGREYFKGNYHCMVQDICKIIIDEKEVEKFEEVAQYWFEEAVEQEEVVRKTITSKYECKVCDKCCKSHSGLSHVCEIVVPAIPEIVSHDLHAKIDKKVGRRLYTDLEKIEAKIKSYARNKLWQLENKTKFDAYMKSYYVLNKSRLNAQRTANRKKQLERQQLISTDIVADIVVN